MIPRAIVVGYWKLLVAVSLVSMPLFASGCSSNPPARPPVGAVGLGLHLSGATNIEKVDFRISGNGIMPIAGVIDVMNSMAAVSSFVGGMPPARGYRIEMMATSTDGRTTCTGDASFDIIVNQTASVSVGVQCRGPADMGGVVVGGTLNSCPVLTAVIVSPIAVPVGQVIDLGAEAFDADTRDTLAFHWSGGGGSIASGKSAYTSFLCSVGGTQTLTVTVTDGMCNDIVNVGVNCVPPRCGNGVIEPGEQCDPPGGITCDLSCQRLTICGNAVVERTEQCDPPNATTCDSMCRRIAPDGGSVAAGGGGGAGGNGAGENGSNDGGDVDATPTD